ncbi:glutamine amidotransferase [Bacillus sp. V3-13]|uniref:type 1 glutamine amidotransferase n=1 Tax=Bacillus sp. V3-13 TaxID=2053728 RepID=UPI000C7617F0|nr:glutamine amidotransferase [Bacillus sp. V3-13]PLR77413.1 glutamine amidotransferase [Bacillus sp. V3-13]
MERNVPLQSSKQLTLYHFFPDKLNLYGDRGNIISLIKRCEWRGIDLDVKEIRSTDGLTLEDMDLFFIGGGSDREQSLATAELQKIRNQLKEKIENGVPGLTICGGYQFLGNQYIDANGNELECLGILEFYTVAKQPRLTGNILIQSELFGEIAGFENHAGRTYHSYPPLGKVEKGSGNNDDSGLEGLLYKNLIGTYLHGPILPKNPAIADYLITKAIEHRYEKETASEWMTQLEDDFEHLAKKQVWRRVQHG